MAYKLQKDTMQSLAPYNSFEMSLKYKIKIPVIELCLSNDPFGIASRRKEIRIYRAGSK